MTDIARKQSRSLTPQFTLIESVVVPLTTSSIELGEIDVVRAHCFAAVKFFIDVDGDFVAIPTAGSVEFSIMTVNLMQFETILLPKVNLQAQGGGNRTVDWRANTEKVRVDITGQISGGQAMFWRMTVTCNGT